MTGTIDMADMTDLIAILYESHDGIDYESLELGMAFITIQNYIKIEFRDESYYSNFEKNG